MINALVVIALLATTDVLAGAKTGGEKKGYTYEQQIRRGEREAPNLVTARRVFMGWIGENLVCIYCLLYTSPSPRDRTRSRMPSSA